MSPASATWPSGAGRAWLVFVATVAPELSGWWAYSIAAPEWQSDQFSDYVALVLANTAIVFAPFLLYASACLILAIFGPRRWLSYFAVRFGVYSGILLSIHLIVVWLGAIGGGAGPGQEIVWLWLCLGLLAPFVWRATARFLRRRSERFRANAVIALAALLPLIALVGCAFDPFSVVLAPLAIVWLSLPSCCFLAYVRAARLVYRGYGGEGQFSLLEILWLTSWSGAYMGTWRISVTHALEEYAKLPKTPPTCYVCTAAAYGHPWLVGSRRVTLADGATIRVNLQTCRLKAAEIALRVAFPRCHAAVRAVYNYVGPRAARRLNHPLAADIAYLTLKPAEGLAIFIMRRLVRDIDSLAVRLYEAL